MTMQPLSAIRMGRNINGWEYTPEELDRNFPGGQWRGGYFFTAEEVARYTAQMDAEREPIFNPRGYLADIMRSRGVRQPYTIDAVVKDVLAVARSEGKDADRARLLELLEIELRARRQILEMAQARDAREAKKESPMTTKQSPFASSAPDWRRDDHLFPELDTIHTEAGRPTTPGGVRVSLNAFLEASELESVSAFRGDKQAFLATYRTWLITEDEPDAQAIHNEEAAIEAPPPPPVPTDWRKDETKLAQFWAAVATKNKALGMSTDDATLKAMMIDFLTSRGLSGLDAWTSTAGSLITAYADWAANMIDTPEAPDEPPAEKPAQKAQEGAGKRQDVSTVVPPPNRPANPPPQSANGASSKALATVDHHRLPSTGNPDWETRKQQAEIMIRSGLLPRTLTTPEQVLTVMMMADMLGLAPLAAVNGIDVLQGKPTIKPQLMLALIRRSGQLESMEVVDDGKCCTVRMTRRGEPTHIETFDMDDARALGLASKDNWQKQAKTMRKWRAIAAAARIVFPDVIWGMYTPEELGSTDAYIE